MSNTDHTAHQPPGKVSFYIVPHADDWQLFMYPNVYHDLLDTACKVVFIIVTAGDSGRENGYWPAREEGSKSSVRFCLAPRMEVEETAGVRMINQHPISYTAINNTITYFLRLPDGNLDGSGFTATQFQSLRQLKNETIDALTTIDSSTIYTGWQGLIDTIEAITSAESGQLSGRYIHYLNPDEAANPGDHADHLVLGLAIQRLPSLSTFVQCVYVGYGVTMNTENLSPPALFHKAGMFAVYEKAVYDGCGYSTLRENPELYSRWCCSPSNYLTIPQLQKYNLASEI